MIVFIRKSDANEPFSFLFTDDSRQTILRSENYTTKKAALNGIESVKKNCISIDRYQLKTAKNGKHFFNIKARNGQIVATSAMFSTPEELQAGINLLQREALSAELEEVDLVAN